MVMAKCIAGGQTKSLRNMEGAKYCIDAIHMSSGSISRRYNSAAHRPTCMLVFQSIDQRIVVSHRIQYLVPSSQHKTRTPTAHEKILLKYLSTQFLSRVSYISCTHV